MKDAATVQAASAVDPGRICTICVALLGQSNKLESAIAARKNPMESINVDGFSKLLDTVGVQCTPQDKQAIFTMIDPEGHGTIEAKALKTALRKSGAISRMYEDSLRTFGMLVTATLLFDAGIFAAKGGTAAFDFMTAYVIEDSLSVDNLFVFLLIFRAFKVPPQLVDPCLNYGIFGSIVLRGFFIFAGLAAVSAFQPLLLGFSGFLIYTSYQMLTDAEEEEEPDVPPLVTAVLKRLPLSNTFEGEAFTVPSAMSKAGLNAMTQSLAVEWGGRGIRLNAIAPGLFPTEGMSARLNPGGGEHKAVGNPMGRTGRMSELANLAVFLMGPGADYLNGQTIAIDGAQYQATGGNFAHLSSWTDADWQNARESIAHKNATDRRQRQG